MANIWAYTKLRSVIDQKLISQFTPGQLIGEVSSEIPVVLVLIALYTAFKPDLGRTARPASLPARPFAVLFGTPGRL
jgi:hypothetical protein